MSTTLYLGFAAIISVSCYADGSLSSVKFNLRIVGGKQASPHQFPFIVSLRNKNGEHFCAGSILNEQWILTSAHCSYGFQPSEFSQIQIVAGDNDVMSSDESEQTTSLLKIINHPEFNLDTQPPPNDIGLWQTTQDFNFDVNQRNSDLSIHPVALDRLEYAEYKNGIATVAGWGRYYKNGFLPQMLRKVVVPIVDLERCGLVWEDLNQFLSEKMLCAGAHGKGTCSGDSGGPLMCHLRTPYGLKMVQCGIVSSGYPCAVGYPDIYTKVQYFLDFIKQTIALHSRPTPATFSSTANKPKNLVFPFWQSMSK